MAEQQLLLADAVERIAGGARSAEPYTVRDLLILTDVDPLRDYHRDLLCVGASRFTDRLRVCDQSHFHALVVCWSLT